MASEPGDKRVYQDMVAAVREKLAALSTASHIRSAFPDERVLEIAEKIERETPAELPWTYWPPLLVFLECNSLAEIESLDRDIDLVVRHSTRKSAKESTNFLKAQASDDRLWCGGIFETFIKSHFLRQKDYAVELDWPLPNGREVDVRLERKRRLYFLECTVITDSDEDRETWDRFMAATQADPDTVLVRPGELDSSHSKSPSPYYDCLRFYAKVYDKVARDLDPQKSQMAEDSPNVPLVSFYSVKAPVCATSPGVGWALDELFADQPKSGARLKEQFPGSIDTSFLAWLDFTAADLHNKARLIRVAYCESFSRIVAASRELGGIFLFDRSSLRASRVNYNADPPCKVSHSEIAALESLFLTSHE